MLSTGFKEDCVIDSSSAEYGMKQGDETISDRTRLRDRVRLRSKVITDPAGRKEIVLSEDQALQVATECNCSHHEVYIESLGSGIWPHRYLRNREIISLEEQLKLANSRVTVVGTGGLGGHVILLLARLGIGHLVIVDHDAFDETNLNRQPLCSVCALGKPKVGEAAATVNRINPGVLISTHLIKMDSSNAEEILRGSQVAVDGLDSVSDRIVLETATRKLGISLVHGAVAGFGGQLMTIFPGDLGVKYLYGDEIEGLSDRKSPELVLGVPAVTVSLIATFQTMEVLKIILNRGRVYRKRIVCFDLEYGQINEIPFEESS